jgi:hypothetical protein
MSTAMYSFYAGGHSRRPLGPRPQTSPPKLKQLARSASHSALPAKLLDLTVDMLPRPRSGVQNPTSRMSNHAAFSPQGSACSPGMLPLRRTRTMSKLSAASAQPAKPHGQSLAKWAIRYYVGNALEP